MFSPRSLWAFALGLICLLAFSIPAQAADPASAALNRAAASWQQGRALEALTQTRQALRDIWAGVPFQLMDARLVTAAPGGFGIFTPHPNNIFEAQKAEMWFYLEPVGYRVDKTADGLFKFGFSLDLLLVDEKGEVKAGQEKFLVREVLSRRFNTEFFIQVQLTLSDLPPGKLTVVIRVNDLLSKKYTTTRFPLEFH